MALNFAMNTQPGNEAASELYPNVAAVGAIYGDTNGNYTNFLSKVDEAYPAEPYFLWNQPLTDGGWVSLNPDFGGDTGSTNNTNNSNGNSGNGTSSGGSTGGSAKVAVGVTSLTTLSVLAAWILA